MSTSKARELDPQKRLLTRVLGLKEAFGSNQRRRYPILTSLRTCISIYLLQRNRY
jgi:hypothetical protein